MKCLVSLISWLLVALAVPVQAQKPFDFYVLSLSWSPEFCAVRPEDRQCGRGYGFVLHGLWPQYQNGYPQNCSNERLSKDLIRHYSDLYPSQKLFFHEWNKHGTCSGLAPDDYLELSQTLKESIKIPEVLQNLRAPLRVTADQLKQQIISANPDLGSDALLFSCADSGRFLQEFYLCFDNTGTATTACSAEMQKRSQKSCAQKNFVVRNLR